MQIPGNDGGIAPKQGPQPGAPQSPSTKQIGLGLHTNPPVVRGKYWMPTPIPALAGRAM